MYRYTTPTIPITIDTVDFDLVDVFRVAIENGNTELLFVIPANDVTVDPENHTINVVLTQEQTAQLAEGHAKIQVRIRYKSGSVQATAVAKLKVNDVLDEVIV